jgi:hypothetical protein
MNRNNRPGGMEFRSFKKDGQTLSSRNLDQPIDVVSCDVVAWASVRASAADLPGLRKAPGTLGDQPMANGLLRHVDEQTVVAVAAVLQAVRDSGLEPSSFDRWSVLAAPRFLGRAKFEASFPEYRDEGAWSVSPHLIPGHSLHSPSGTISQALHAHGANLGIGGTPGGEREAFLVAATWLEAGWSEGVWIILTSRDPEATGEVAVSEPGDYRALAFALVGSRPELTGPKLRIGPNVLTLEGDSTFKGELLDWIEPTEQAMVDGDKTWRADPGHGSPTSPRTDKKQRSRERL